MKIKIKISQSFYLIKKINLKIQNIVFVDILHLRILFKNHSEFNANCGS